VGVRTEYLDIGGDALAYQVFGQGPGLTFVLGLSSHVDLRWSIGSVRTNLDVLGSLARVISFDRRGTGASERLSTDRLPTWEDWADDLRHVLNAVGSTRTWLLAALDGGPYALMFAAAHPDRVHGLILANTGAKYLEDPTFPEGVPVADAEAVLEAIEHGWGTEAFAALTASDDPSEYPALAVLQRASASPSLAAAQFRWSSRATSARLPLRSGCRRPCSIASTTPSCPSGSGATSRVASPVPRSWSSRVAGACSTGPIGSRWSLASPSSWPACRPSCG
jgi:pimeloyl-ACP methyl ester carboxylesterase